jgi:hypothetical protein
MTDGQIDSAEWRWVYISSGLLILLTLLPYLWAYGIAAPDHRFAGILVNPFDGNSYLAKMRQGFDGEWLFHLPFTPEPHQPVFLFTFYLFLGHVARWLAMPLALVFHTARVVGSLFMLLMVYMLIADWTDDLLQRRITWGLVAVGSGFGWLAVAAGRITPDLTVPEAFPLYAALANAHFPWAIGLVAYIAHTLSRAMLDESRGMPTFEPYALGLIGATAFLVTAQPFGPFALGAGVGVFLAWRWWRYRQFPKRQFAWALVVLLAALPQLLYGLGVVSAANPIFHEWHAQNQTPSPPVWDYLIAYGPLLLLAGLAIWKSWRTLSDGEHDADVLLLGWLVANALLLYAPVGLQRRLTIGLILPLAIFAGRGLTRVVLPVVRQRWRPIVIAGAFALSVPSTILVLVLPLQGTLTLDSRFYVTQSEQAGLDWLQANASPDDVVLASPGFSLYLPGQAGTRVVYGHPFETVRAVEREAAVYAYYAGDDCDELAVENVAFVVYGPREAAIGDGCRPDGGSVFSSGDITIYQARD